MEDVIRGGVNSQPTTSSVRDSTCSGNCVDPVSPSDPSFGTILDTELRINRR